MRKSLRRKILTGLVAIASYFPLSCASLPEQSFKNLEKTITTPTKIHSIQESSTFIDNTSLPDYQKIRPQLLSKPVEIESEVYENRIWGIQFYSTPRPEWFSSDEELKKISSTIGNISSYDSLENLMSEFKENSFYGKVWVLSSLSTLIYSYNYNPDRNFKEAITENELFGSLKESYSTGEKIPKGVCADFAYFLTKAGKELGLEIAEIHATNTENAGGHAISLTYDKNYGYVTIDGRDIIFTNTHNRELAEKIYQKERNFVNFTSEIYQGDEGVLLLELTDEGKLLAKAWEYDETSKNFKEKLLREKIKDISTEIKTEEGNQYFFVRPQIGNIFFKQGYIQGDELSTLGKSNFILTGLEFSGKTIDFKSAIGYFDANIGLRKYLDYIVSLELNIKKDIEITQKYSLIPGASLSYLYDTTFGGKTPENFIKHLGSFNNIHLGISDKLQLNNGLKLNNYLFEQIKINSRTYNQQRPKSIIPYSFHVGQEWSHEKDRKESRLNLEFFVAKPEYGISLEFSSDLNNDIYMSFQGSRSISRIKPFNPDKLNLKGEISIKPDNVLEIYLKGGYSNEFWPVTPKKNYFITTGTSIKLPN